MKSILDKATRLVVLGNDEIEKIGGPYEGAVFRLTMCRLWRRRSNG